MTRFTSLYLRLVCAAYLCAFLSDYLQLPGLIGYDGLEPAGALLRRANGNHDVPTSLHDAIAKFSGLPTLAWFAPVIDVPVDSIVDACCVVGALLATLGCAGAFCGLSFAAMWLAYVSVYLVGGTFLSFQWDILLLEAGFLAIFMPAPLPWCDRWLLPPGQAASAPFMWLTRFLLFKLMFMAGMGTGLTTCYCISPFVSSSNSIIHRRYC